MAKTENGSEADDKTGSNQHHDEADPIVTVGKLESDAPNNKQILPSPQVFLQYLHSGIEFCGKHPFTTGLFALMSLAGLVLSIIGFQQDREEAVSSTEHGRRVESKLEDISEKIGTSYRGGIFLYEERIEIYWNEWWAHPLQSEEETREYGQADLTIRGEGKTVDFVGLLSMNCSNGNYFWRGVENFYTPLDSDEEIAELVPDPVFRNVHRLFCRTR